MLVLMRLDGSKELIALAEGLRESSESWADVLRDVPASRNPRRQAADRQRRQRPRTCLATPVVLYRYRAISSVTP